ncbi:hypothetical protein ACFE04_022657 [Oxalis oulophora]
MEGCTIALTILTKTVITNNGMNPYVFVVYANAFSSLLLLPYSFFFHYNDHRTLQQPITFRLLVRCFFLGLTGIALAQNLAFMGLSYSSPVVVCAMGLLLPSISFILSIIFRRKTLDWNNPSFYVYLIGILISIMGATVEELYIGPFIRNPSTSPSYLLSQENGRPLFVYLSSTNNWILGCQLLAASFFSVSLWNLIQQGTTKEYPQVMKIAAIYSIMGTIQCTIFALYVERDINAWKLNLDMELLVIVLTGIFASIIRSSFHVSFTRTKGPFYVPLFKPFGIVFATIFGVALNSIHYGSVIGAAVAGMGYYIVMLENIKEDEIIKNKYNDIESNSIIDPEDIKVPLLQKESEV